MKIKLLLPEKGSEWLFVEVRFGVSFDSNKL